MRRKINLRSSSVLSETSTPYIVAEMNTSHFGCIDTAKKMISTAKEIGCDCVKFQSWSADSLYSKSYFKDNPIAKRIFNKFALTESELLDVARFCKETGIDFSSTPYSRAEVDFLLEQCDAAFVKVASMDLNNYKFLDYIASTGAPIVLSTGMSEIDEIRKAVKTIENAGNKNICLLHCTSIYPAEPNIIQLKNIIGLMQEFPDYLVGYSDHSIGTEIPSAAIAMGACLIEKHFTLDSSKIGMDNQMASEPEEMKTLVKSCHNVFNALGTNERVIFQEEIEQREKMRRSIIVTKDLKAGTILSAEDLDVKRPGLGLDPERLYELVGKTLINDLEGDTMISESDFH